MNDNHFSGTEPEINALRDHITAARCEVFAAGSRSYDDATDIWNGAVEYRPALVARCLNVQHVQAGLAAARENGVPVSVKGGGHDWCGRGIRHGGLVLDLSSMQKVSVNADSKVAVIEGGTLGAMASMAAESAGLAVVTGYSGAVGMPGLITGGGYGPLMTRFGLAADNLTGADVVLADGRHVSTDSEQNADLFWALRGGGGNFGVVTSMRVRLHELAGLVSGVVIFPWTDAQTVFRGYAEMMESAPDELSAAIVMSTGADGNPVIAVAPTWSGEPAKAHAVFERLQRLGKPVLTRMAPMTCSEMLAAYDTAQVVNGRHNEVRTRWLSHLSTDAIARLIEGFNARTSRLSSVVTHHFHGAGTRVSPAATPFGMRQPHFTALIYSTWEAGSDGDAARHRRWADDLSSQLAPLALRGGYANLLSPDAREQIEAAYGENGQRLREVKAKYDPKNVFSSAIPLPT
jgi:FAD/FMN-containing dehydrogenase